MPDYGVAVLRSPLHGWHTDQNARFKDWCRWLVPTTFASPEQEITSATDNLAIADLSAFTRLSFQGPDVPSLTWALASDSPAMKPGGIASFVTLGEGLACRIAEDELLLLSSTAHMEAAVQYLNQLCANRRVVLLDVTSGLAEFCLIGKAAFALLGRLTALDLDRALPPASCAGTNLAGVHAILVRPPQAAAVRLCVPWDVAEYVWTRLFEIGQEYQIVPIGLEAAKGLVPIGYP